MHGKWIGLVAIALVASAMSPAKAQDDTFDSAVYEREVAAIQKLGKSAMPVYSLERGKVGTITLENGKLECANGSALYLSPLGWLVDSSLELGNRAAGYVLVNVGNQSVKVGEHLLKPGEYAIIQNAKLVKVTAKEIK